MHAKGAAQRDHHDGGGARDDREGLAEAAMSPDDQGDAEARDHEVEPRRGDAAKQERGGHDEHGDHHGGEPLDILPRRVRGRDLRERSAAVVGLAIPVLVDRRPNLPELSGPRLGALGSTSGVEIDQDRRRAAIGGDEVAHRIAIGQDSAADLLGVLRARRDQGTHHEGLPLDLGLGEVGIREHQTNPNHLVELGRERTDLLGSLGGEQGFPALQPDQGDLEHAEAIGNLAEGDHIGMLGGQEREHIVVVLKLAHPGDQRGTDRQQQHQHHPPRPHDGMIARRGGGCIAHPDDGR